MTTKQPKIKLTKHERTALENVAAGKEISFRIWQVLQTRGLLGYDEGRDEDYLTPLGRCALMDTQPAIPQPLAELAALREQVATLTAELQHANDNISILNENVQMWKDRYDDLKETEGLS